MNKTLLFAQNTMEFVQDGTFNSYEPPIPIGPTSIPQTLAFFTNKDGSHDEGIYFYKPQSALTLTFGFDDQQFLTVPQHITGMTFGALSGAAANHVRSTQVVNNSYYFFDSARTVFTAHPEGPAGRGIRLHTNASLHVFLSAKPLLAKAAATSDTSRYYYGKLRLHFSRPVSNPVLSLAGLGATTNFAGKHLGFSTELELQTPGLELVKISGNDQLELDDTGTKILHARTFINGNCESGAACGSIVVNGSAISNLVFGVFLRTDGGPGIWGTEKVTNSGDMWHITVSLPEQ
ncbi:hypothetical protein [Dyadobacter sediminis]|uniref:Uncharacterized protein n=1 Tax=Dyadobacter sediminis TaxID=1493691 RepID=A0A5R9KL02_9BACT|nr:hypothetical protein [Dyadobacter sediminis]TLU96874.1 hypothetical protein FEM55_07060 [Dyadobacter sediminis]